MSEIVVAIPDAKTPGYLRRLIEADRFGKMIKSGDIDYEQLVSWILTFVSEPEDRDEAREALLDATLEQYKDVIDAITKLSNPTSPEPTETS